MDRRYYINFFRLAEDAAWIADVPDLRFCNTLGLTPDMTLAEVEVAMEAWLETVETDGSPVPETRYRPAIYGMPFAA